MQLYQKSPLKNVILGNLIACSILFAAYLLEKYLLGNFLFRLCESYYLLEFTGFYKRLLWLPGQFLSVLFLFYWLTRYVDEQIRKARFVLKKAIGPVLILFALQAFALTTILPQPKQLGAQLAVLGVKCLIYLTVTVFGSAYWLYAGLVAQTAEQPLDYRQFLKKLFRFVKDKFYLIPAYIGCFLGTSLFIYIIFLIYYLADPTLFKDPIPFPYNEIILNILETVTILFPLFSAKIYVAFTTYFIGNQTPMQLKKAENKAEGQNAGA